VLEAVGIDPMHELVLRSVLTTPRRTTSQVAETTGLATTQVEEAVRTLEELGFLTRLGDCCLVPARPDAAVEALAAQRRLELDLASAAARALTHDMRVRDQHRPENLVDVVVGRNAIAARFAHLIETTQHSLLVLDRPPYVADGDDTHDRIRRLLGAGVSVRAIYASDSLDEQDVLPEAMRVAADGVASRVHAQVPMKLAVFDESTALLPLSGDRLLSSALVVQRSSLVDALGELFELLWRDALPVIDEDDVDPGLDPQLMALLSAGLKDDAIARQLHVSSRTVGRRVADLMADLGARTRFQAGLFVQRRARHTNSED
jgi:hypothetical protein